VETMQSRTQAIQAVNYQRIGADDALPIQRM
jgi:hypothetical protein